jgi:DNA-binding SARP family transcriptional activator
MTVRLSLLDAFELTCDDVEVPLPLSAQRLLAFLALHPRPLLRGYIAGALWPDTSEERAHASLRSALWRLRRPGRRLTQARVGRLGLDAAVALDLREFEELAHRVLERDGSGRALSDAASELIGLSGDLLPDWYDDWVLVEREHVRQLRLHALEALCDRLLEAGGYAAATETALAVIASDPLRESAHRALIRVHLAEGNIAEALRQYAFFRRLSERRLGLDPSADMEQLIGAVTPR